MTVTDASVALATAEAHLTACTEAVTTAEHALTSYRQRAADGLAVSPSTLGDRVAAVDLAALQLAGAERAVTAARERLADAVRTSAELATEAGTGGLADREQEARARIADMLTAALDLARQFTTERDQLLEGLADAGVEASLPRAVVLTSAVNGKPARRAELVGGGHADLAVIADVTPPPTPVDLQTRGTHLALRAGGRGVVINGAIYRASWDPERAAVELVIATLTGEPLKPN